MKTPRQLLMERHRPIEPRLSAVRQQVLSNLAGAEAKITETEMPATTGLFAGWFEVLRPFHFNVAGLGFTCLLIVTFKLATPEMSNSVVAKSTASSPDMLAALQEKRRLYAELSEEFPASSTQPPKAMAPKPRSERLESWSSV